MNPNGAIVHDAHGATDPSVTDASAAPLSTAPLSAAPLSTAPLEPMRASERSLAPDLARGFMLLFIALANVPGYLYGRALDEGGMIDGTSGWSRIAHSVILLLVENRSRPMFAILYGFGMAMIASRVLARANPVAGGDPGARKLARKVLARRSLWLTLLGALHSIFLFLGDILAPYGVTGLIALGFVVASDKALRRALWIFGAGVVLVSTPALALLLTPSTTHGEDLPSMNGETYLESMATGAVTFIIFAMLCGLLAVFVPLALGGVMLFRAGWITAPEKHLRPLKRASVIGIATGVLTALPTLAIAMGWWTVSAPIHVAATYVNLLGGTVAGFGYICAFALLAHALRGWGRRGPVRAIVALGERSLSGYLLQSIVSAPLLSAWGFNLAEDRGYGFAFVFAVGTWLVTVLVALGFDKAGWRGPFEVLLRRLSYR